MGVSLFVLMISSHLKYIWIKVQKMDLLETLEHRYETYPLFSDF